jgi:tetratricopeptide (TPR) repeat protein
MKQLIEREFESDSASSYSIVIAALTLYLMAGQLEDAYSLLMRVDQQCSQGSFPVPGLHRLEIKGVLVYILLILRRVDLAKEVVSWMKNNGGEFSVATLLAEAMLLMSSGDSSGRSPSQDATFILQELMDTHGKSSLLYHMEAICSLQLGDSEAAISCLEEAHRLNSEDSHVLANLVVLSLRLREKTLDAQRYTDLLTRIQPRHPLLVRTADLESRFDNIAAQYQ